MKSIKYLGQNFLNSKKIVEEIAVASDLQPTDIVLEVGPGKGILTEMLLEKVSQGLVIAVEKDKRLIEFLKEKFSDKDNLKLINDDILKFADYSILDADYKIVANIPYYITSHFLRKFLSESYQPSKMVLMVQKEVAERIVARSTGGRKKESILSISVKAYGQPRIIKKVPARFFSPKPKVDSAILFIDNISKDFFRENGSRLEEGRFFEILKQGFSSKRKMLINNLKCRGEIFEKCKIDKRARAENLSLESWKCLAGAI